MPIRGIDNQIMVSKTPEASVEQARLQRLALNNGDITNERVRQDAEQSLEIVQDTQQAEQNAIDEHMGGGNRDMYQRMARRKAGKKKPEEEKDSENSSEILLPATLRRIDIDI